MIKKFTIQVILRISLIALCCMLLAHFAIRDLWFTVSAFGVLICIQIITLIRYVNQTNYSLSRFLNALKTEDYSVYFAPTGRGDSFARIYNDFNKILSIFKQNKIEKEAQFRNFKQILEFVNLGIISIRKEDVFGTQSENEILFLNRAAAEILNQPRHKYWHRLQRQIPWFCMAVKQLSNGGKTLIDFSNEQEHKQLSLEVLDVRFLDIPYLIVTFQDIRSEIEQKEIEAWHNVIRVLAHEMLNSFTPVSSLASSIKQLTENDTGKSLKAEQIDSETIQDINAAASTIKKRSDGLLEFVKDYRALSNVPVPKLQSLNIKEFLYNIERLMKNELKKKNISIELKNIPSRAELQADYKLLEQILINLIGNSVNILENTPEPKITISCEIEEFKTIIHVHDNGPGIPMEILNQIFIPFFTTRKNGSGIGLSLSKNIMKQHGGKLLVSTEPGKFTNFSMIFNTK